MVIDRLKALVLHDFEAVNALIINQIHAQIGLVDELGQHIIKSGGKRLRPLLVLLATHACGYQGFNHIKLAAMIEFFHTATLLHDDVVDESTLRRGKETANEIWGSKASILVGDYLFTQSVQLMVEVGDWPILRLLADTSHQISCGEVKQLANRGKLTVSVEDYLSVIQQKTALLFAASAAIGPLLTLSPEPIKQGFYNYGLHLGNAFQLIDDALDYCADSKIMGKNIGNDLADKKITMPLLCVLEHGNPSQQELVKQSLSDGDLTYLPEILTAIEATNAIALTKNFAANEVKKACLSLAIVPDSIYKQALIELAESSLQRNH